MACKARHKPWGLLGVAIAGTALFIALGNQLTTTVNNNPSINPALKQATEAAQKRGIQVVTPNC